MKRVLRFLRGNVFSAIGFMLIATGAANILNYVYNVITARLLGPERYGEFAALLSILLILTVPALSLQALITKYVAEFLADDDPGRIRELVINFLKICVYAALIIIVFFLAFRGLIADYLHIESELPIVICGLTSVATLFQPGFAGVLQGYQRFAWLGVFFVLYATARMVAGSLLIVLGGGVSGALAGSIIGILISILLAYAVMKDVFIHREAREHLHIKDLLRSYLPIIGVMLVFFAIVSFDQIIVKRKFAAAIAGEYACAVFLGKIILYFPGAVAIVLYPKFVESQWDRKELIRLLIKGSWITMAASLMISAIFIAFPGKTISVLYGSEYIGASSILWIFCLAMSGYSLINLYIYYFLAVNRARFIGGVLSVAFVAQVFLMYVPASSPFQVAAVHLITAAFLITASIWRIAIE